MPYVKFIAGHTDTGAIRSYFERNGRALAVDYLNLDVQSGSRANGKSAGTGSIRFPTSRKRSPRSRFFLLGCVARQCDLSMEKHVVACFETSRNDLLLIDHGYTNE
jgi:hypothetical protein